jgi:hypothetical protein
MPNAVNVLMLQTNVWHAHPGNIFWEISALLNVLQQVLLWSSDL